MTDPPTADNATQQGPGGFYQPGWQVNTVNQVMGDQHVHKPLPTWPLYINIPPLPKTIVGREDLITHLVARLCAGTTTALSAEGLPGVGKTTLAVALAHDARIRDHFSDGVLWAGLGPNADPVTQLNLWAEALGLDLSDKPTAADRARAVRNAISGRRLLLVIDDAWALEPANLLRCSGPDSVHLLTTRYQLLAAEFGQMARVEVLTPDAARNLLQKLAPKAYVTDPTAAEKLLEAVGYLPLAIELLGGYLNAGASARFARPWPTSPTPPAAWLWPAVVWAATRPRR